MNPNLNIMRDTRSSASVNSLAGDLLREENETTNFQLELRDLETARNVLFQCAG